MKDGGKRYWYARIVNQAWHGERSIGRAPPTTLTDPPFRWSRKTSSPFSGNGEWHSCQSEGTSQKGTLEVAVHKESWLCIATIASKTWSTFLKPRSRECPGRQHGNDSTDNTIGNDTDPSAECDIPIHRSISPEAPQMPNSPPAVAPQHPTTRSLSAITTHPLNSPTVHSDITNPANPKPIAASGSQDPPVSDANHRGETRNQQAEGPSPKQPNKIDSTGGTTCRCGKARRGRQGKKPWTFFFHYT